MNMSNREEDQNKVSSTMKKQNIQAVNNHSSDDDCVYQDHLSGQRTQGKAYTIRGEIISDKAVFQRMKNIRIPVTELCGDLISELEKHGIIERLRQVPRYGTQTVYKHLNHSRYDYMVQQINLHWMARKVMKSDFMAYSYGNIIMKTGQRNVTFLDAAMIMAILSNIGHFKTTFVGSRAAVQACRTESYYKDLLLSEAKDARFADAVKSILDNENYSRFHLLNALVLLEKCNPDLCSVKASVELLYMILDQPCSIDSGKKDFFIHLYRRIRDISYLQTDLRLAPVPVRILSDSQSIGMLMTELLSKYNDQSTTVQMIDSLKKFLDDSLFCVPRNIFREEGLAAGIVRRANILKSSENDAGRMRNWSDYILSDHSVFNTVSGYTQKGLVDFSLKLTFENKAVYRIIREKTEHMEHVLCAGYNRGNGSTLLIAIRKNSERPGWPAFRVLQLIISLGLKNKETVNNTHIILAVKFFLEQLFGKNAEICCSEKNGDGPFISYGSRQRIEKLKKVIDQNSGSDDRKHEIEALGNNLQTDRRNDAAVILPCDIKLWNKTGGKTEKELDGMIIFPNRTKGQIVFAEAKNRKGKPSRAGNDLADKLEYLHIPFEKESIKTISHDAFFCHTLKRG